MTPAAIWAELPAEHRHWILLNALLVTAVINLVVNGVIDLISIAGKGPIPFWGPPLVDTNTVWTIIGTLFLLPLITCLLVTTFVRRDERLGTLPPLTGLGHSEALPESRLRRGLLFGGVIALFGAPPIILVLAAFGVGDLSHAQYTAWHIAFAVVLGALVTPVIALCAMTDRPE